MNFTTGGSIQLTQKIQNGLFRSVSYLDEAPLPIDSITLGLPDSSSEENGLPSSINDLIQPLLPPQINYDKIAHSEAFQNDTYFFRKFYFNPSFHNVMLLLFLVFFTIWIILLNCLTIVGLWKTHKKGHVADLYIANLAVGDVLLGILILPLMSVVILIGYFPFSSFVCDSWVFLDYYLIVSSSFGNTALMCNYLWMIRSPETFPVDFRHHILAIILCWIAVNVAWTPPFFYDRLSVIYPTGQCGFSIAKNSYYSFYIGVSGFYLPLAISLICGIWSVIVLKQNSGLPLFSLRQSVNVRIRGRSRMQSLEESFKTSRLSYLPENQEANGYKGQKKMTIDSRTYLRSIVRRSFCRTVGDPHEISTVAREHYPLVATCFVIFVMCRSFFYVYFGVGSFVHSFFPPDLSNGVYWLMHSNAAISPVVHFCFDPELRQAIIEMLGIRNARNSSVVEPIMPRRGHGGTRKGHHHNHHNRPHYRESNGDNSNSSGMPSISIANERIHSGVSSLEHFMYLPKQKLLSQMESMERSPPGGGLHL